jgi:hypothetical protein
MIRLHQALVTLTVLSSCYAPDLRDCTVTCSGASACAGGQVCGPDGYCAAPGVAGMCGALNGVDAASDATPRVVLHIQIMGNGRVDVTGAGTCSSASGPGDCLISVPKGMVQLRAIVVDKPFDLWTTAPCTGQTTTCVFDANIATTVGARFH